MKTRKNYIRRYRRPRKMPEISNPHGVLMGIYLAAERVKQGLKYDEPT